MADATWHTNSVEDQTDLLTRLNRVFDKFWQKLKNRKHQTTSKEPKDHSSFTAYRASAADIRGLGKGPKMAAKKKALFPPTEAGMQTENIPNQGSAS
ncbi:Hypothetical predicted protein [Pelobates cultripes]|uniref:Uncharacterized protein n=1 Tax=Pelobates cultripes TaxID=61616 RepID=A0AAD1R6V7_PELCU|nr:Hypothetical predicted protein [Pelobates cultripes]